MKHYGLTPIVFLVTSASSIKLGGRRPPAFWRTAKSAEALPCFAKELSPLATQGYPPFIPDFTVRISGEGG